MVGILAVLRTVGRLALRDLRTLTANGANNFFLFCLLLERSGAFLWIVAGLLILFPLSADPLRRVPLSRWNAWPLSAEQRAAIRAGSFLLSPAAWITAAMVFLWSRPADGLRFAALSLGIGAGSVGLSTLAARVPSVNPLRHIPAFPGRFGGLVRKDVRQMLSMLDPYCALVLAMCGTAFRLAGQADRDTRMGITLLVVLAVSTYAQLLFGLDSDSGLARYRLMPISGWAILGAKDAAFLLVTLPMVLPLLPQTGLAAAMAALTIGHHTSVTRRIPQQRWRFGGGGSLVLAAFQVAALFSAGVMAAKENWFLIPCLGAYLISLGVYGRMFDRQAV